MTAWRKILVRVLDPAARQGIRFTELCALLHRLGFEERSTSGSHRVFQRQGVPEIINLQPRPDGSAKPYQVKQVGTLILKYRLALPPHEEPT